MSPISTQSQTVNTSPRFVTQIHNFSAVLLLQMSVGCFSMTLKWNVRAIITKTQNFSFIKVVNENYIDQFLINGVWSQICAEEKTVNSKLYVQVKEMLVKWILRVKQQFQGQGSCFLVHSNAPACSAMIGQHFLAIVVQFRRHPSYFSWTHSRWFFCSLNWKLSSTGECFRTSRRTYSSSSVGTTAHCGFWPVEQYLSIFPYLSPTLSIFSLPALEDLFPFLLSILSWVFLFVSSLPVLEWRSFWASYPPPLSPGDPANLSFAPLSILLYFLCLTVISCLCRVVISTASGVE